MMPAPPKVFPVRPEPVVEPELPEVLVPEVELPVAPEVVLPPPPALLLGPLAPLLSPVPLPELGVPPVLPLVPLLLLVDPVLLPEVPLPLSVEEKMEDPPTDEVPPRVFPPPGPTPAIVVAFPASG